MIWDNEYAKNECIWGDKPSELAVIAVDYLQEHKLDKKYLNILDIGCGYGRDEIYLSKHLKCTILAIDNSEKAIRMAQNTVSSLGIKNVDFKYCDFTKLRIDKYDVVFVSNLYHILKKNDREKLRVKIMNLLKPEGLLFLNALSINDPEEYGKGASLLDEPHSFQRKKYLHFNIITIAWIGIMSSLPPIIAISFNIPSADHFKETDYCGIVSGRRRNKFEDTNFTPLKSTSIKTPIIKECPFNIECKVIKEVDLGKWVMILGEIAETHVDKDKINISNTKIDISKVNPLVYCATVREYWKIGEKLGNGFHAGKEILQKLKD